MRLVKTIIASIELQGRLVQFVKSGDNYLVTLNGNEVMRSDNESTGYCKFTDFINAVL